METIMYRKVVKPGLIVLSYLLLATVVPLSGYPQPLGEPTAAPQLETRCGWFSNPTPANIWLHDRDGEWTIGVQGGHQVEDDWDWPDFKARQWVKTNGNYGYGCACLQLRVNKETQEVLEIKSSRARPLSVCRQDRSLRKWRNLFK
jgi:hypothetical protein